MTHNLTIQYAPYITVNAIAPGWVDTDMNKASEPEFLTEEKEKICLKRFAQPDEVAELALFLASSKADFINGEVSKIDGGVFL